jgi:hypothetical protein
MTIADDYTFEKMLTNLQGIADQMTEEAMTANASPRVVAAALDATIENLLWLIKGASISWMPPESPQQRSGRIINELFGRERARG